MSNPIGEWIAQRTKDGSITPTARTIAGHRSSAVTGRHWVPSAGPLAVVNQELGDPSLDLWVTCEVRLDATGPRWKARFNVYLHKRKDREVAEDHAFLRRVGEIVGSAVSTSGWKEWRTAVSETQQDLSVTEAYAFADSCIARYAGAVTAGAVPVPVAPAAAARASAVAAAVAPSPAPVQTLPPEMVPAAAPGTTPGTVERQVFIASKIAGYPKARQVRHSIKTKLSGFGYQAYVAESDALGGFLQSNIDRMVETSDHLVAIVWDTIGQATYDEIELATRTAGTSGRPLVHLFVSQDEQHHAARLDEASGLTQAFLDRLDKERRYVRLFQGDRDLVDQVADLFAGLDL